MKLVLLIISVWAMAPLGYARDDEGKLDLILSPNNTRPSLVLPGMSFEVLARDAVELELVSEGGVYSLAVEWADLAGGVAQGICVTPEDIPPGEYSLRGSNAFRSDRNFRSVYVYEQYPETYRVALLSEMRIGAEEGRDTQVYRSIQAINGSGASIVLVTGNLTADGKADQFALALDFLDGCALPTFVYPGEADLAEGLAQVVLGKMPYAFRFGPDGFLGHRLAVSLETDWTGSTGRLHALRRFMRPLRWSVGILGRYRVGLSVREQLILFNDDPLDYVILSGQDSADGGAFEFPWGRTKAYWGPRGGRGAVEYYEVGVRGIVPGGGTKK